VNHVLVLNSTYEPLNVTRIARAVRLVFAGKAEVLESRGAVHTIAFEMPAPRVIRMLYFIARRKRRVPFTKKSVLLRDRYTCAYCGVQGDDTMTVDHVTPRAQRGISTWTNTVTCCAPCNSRKGNRTPHQAQMTLRFKPYEPKFIPFIVVRRFTADHEWSKYLDLYNVGIEERVG
jgi:5-methylcytosine-specific restriction endonuclease McrA